jgi:serine/threonine protein kinase/cytochrome c-type biogenesis protein CcmH/NrfG
MLPVSDEEAIFHAARQLASAEARRDYLRQVCGNLPEVLSRVNALLDAHYQNQDFALASEPSKTATFDGRIREAPGTVIGPYKLLEQIGEGSFGVVFMAEQVQPVRRKVALKILKPGMDTRPVVARFEAERQALALMNHPNIATVLDGGETGSGRPFFVMELVRGVPITEFCDHNRLPIRKRLELFISVCQAVQHAHQKGIIHRDLKPTNVLVTWHDDKPVPKVIDFGIAKATGQQLTEKTLFTNFSMMVGTPMYMSPEQAQMGLDIDTRADIYALGVMLYELLTGVAPLDQERLRTVPFDELRKIIQEEEPARPSMRLSTLGMAASTICTNRGCDPRRLRQLFRGELDWIVMKALEKDRNRRYESAGAFAADVERYLHDQPVQARSPSAGYRLRKLVRRNRLAFALISCVAFCIAMAAGAGLWTLQVQRAQAAERTNRKAADGQKMEAALAEAHAYHEQARQLAREPARARAALLAAQAAVRRCEELLAGNTVEESYRPRLAQLAAKLAEEDKDWRMLDQVEEVLLVGGEPNQKSENEGERVHHLFTEAFRVYGIDVWTLPVEEAGAQIGRRSIYQELVATLDYWAWTSSDRDRRMRLWQIADIADPDRSGFSFRMRHAIAGKRTIVMRALGPEEKSTIRELASKTAVEKQPPMALANLGRALNQWGESQLAVDLLRRAQLAYPDHFWINRELANALLWLKPPQSMEALHFFYASLVARPQNAQTWRDIGYRRLEQNQPDDAIDAFRRAVTFRPDYAEGFLGMANAYVQKRAWDDVVRSYQEALGTNSGWQGIRRMLAMAYINQRNWAQALAEWTEAYRPSTTPQPPSYKKVMIHSMAFDSNVVDVALTRGALLLLSGDRPGYEQLCASILEKYGNTKQPAAAYLIARLCSWAPGAVIDNEKIVNLGEQGMGDKLKLPQQAHAAGLANYRAGQFDRAEELIQQSMKSNPPWPSDVCNWLVLAMVKHRQGHTDEARHWWQKACQWREQEMPKLFTLVSPWSTAWRHPHDWLECHLLIREAEEMFGNQGKRK